MTIAIGLLCKDAIVLASDSQTTLGDFKTQDANKIHSAQLGDCPTIIAEAGHADRSLRAIEILEQLGAGAPIRDYRSVADLATEAMRRLKQEMRREQLDCSMVELMDFIRAEEQDCTLMLGHYFNQEPYIFTVNLLLGGANKVADNRTRHFAVMGTGGELAFYLMRELSRRDMVFTPGIATALFTIGEVKKHDQYCSGSTRLAVLPPGKPAEIWEQDLVNGMATEVERFNEVAFEERNKKISEMLWAAAREFYKKQQAKHLAELESQRKAIDGLKRELPQ